MKIKWNQVTWYSKLLTAIIFFAVILGSAFSITYLLNVIVDLEEFVLVQVKMDNLLNQLKPRRVFSELENVLTDFKEELPFETTEVIEEEVTE